MTFGNEQRRLAQRARGNASQVDRGERVGPSRGRPGTAWTPRSTRSLLVFAAALLLFSSCGTDEGGASSSSSDAAMYGADAALDRPRDRPQDPADVEVGVASKDSSSGQAAKDTGGAADVANALEGATGDAAPSDGQRADVATREGSASDAAGPLPDVGAAEAARVVDAQASDASSRFRVLLFSRTAGFRHTSIPTALAALMALEADGGYVAEATEDATAFTSTNLSRFQVVVFALTSGDALNDAQQVAFEGWLGAGGGYVGIHSASDTEYGWPYYGELVGAYFSLHPAVQTATVRVEATTHPVMAGVPMTWVRRDEWYDFNINPRPSVTVLASLDQSSYTGSTMGADHPIAWVHATAGGGRSFYTALGHTEESYAEPAFRRHLVNGIRWAAQR